MRIREPEPLLAGERGPLRARAEDVQFRRRHPGGDRLERPERSGGVGVAPQKREQLDALIGKPICAEELLREAQRERGPAVGRRGATDPEIDPPGMKRVERPKRLGNLRRAMFGSMIPRGWPASSRHRSDQDLRR